MKYILIILVLAISVKANAQSTMQRTPKGDLYQVFTHNTGEKIKLNDVITFQFIQKTDKDSVLYNTYAAGHPAQAQVQPSQNAGDLMEIFPLLTVNDSAMVKVPTDSIFKGHEDQRPPFFPKGSNLTFILKIEKVQSLTEAIAERNALLDKVRKEEAAGAEKYIANHKLVVKTTATGRKYVITKPSLKLKPQKGDTLLVNYTGRTLDDKVFDSSIAADAQKAGLNQPGRTYEPIQFVDGAGGIIPGWDEGMLLLNEGAKATFIIPSSLAYGEQGKDDIKPFSTLVFDVELVKVKPIKHTAPIKHTVSNPPVIHSIKKKSTYKKKTTVKKTS